VTDRSAKQTVLVLGATGKTGRRVVAQLEARGAVIRTASRRGPVRFDWDDERTWAPALEGADAVYLIKAGGPAAAAAAKLEAFCVLAVARGTHRLVLLSYRDAANEAPENPASERAVMASGGAWTILRPSWFAQNFSEGEFLQRAVLDGELRLAAGDGLEPFIDAEDIAAVAAAVLTRDGHAGRTYDLSGPRLLTFGRAMEEISKASGRDVRYVAVEPSVFAAHAAAEGHSPGFVTTMNELSGWIREGRNGYLSDGVQAVLGRAPRDFTEYVRAAAASGAWNPPARD
jgi:uncharacterized protein YbjT (DUF2867 family)